MRVIAMTHCRWFDRSYHIETHAQLLTKNFRWFFFELATSTIILSTSQPKTRNRRVRGHCQRTKLCPSHFISYDIFISRVLCHSSNTNRPIHASNTLEAPFIRISRFIRLLLIFDSGHGQSIFVLIYSFDGSHARSDKKVFEYCFCSFCSLLSVEKGEQFFLISSS